MMAMSHYRPHRDRQEMSTKNQVPRLSFNVDEAVASTGLNRSAFYRAVALGQIKTFKVGRRRMVSETALREFIATQEKAASSGA